MAQLAANKICLVALASSKAGNLEGELMCICEKQIKAIYLYDTHLASERFTY